MPKYKALVTVVGFLSLYAVSSHADFSWYNTETNKVYYNGCTVALPWGADETVGCFVELIWAGPNNVIDAFDPSSTTGVSGDDQVHQVSYIGANILGVDGVSDNGLWSGSSNGYYYVRVFTAPSPNYGAYQYPTASTNFYAESALWLSPGGASDAFNFGGEGLCSDTLIPEPTALGLGIIGLMSLRLFSRRRK